MKKLYSLLTIIVFSYFSLYAKSDNNTQIIQAGHWIYDSIYAVSTESKQVFFINTQPMTVGELKFWFNQINFEKLSTSGKNEYIKIKDFLYKNDDFLPDLETRVYSNIKLVPELYYKSNENLDWNMNYYFKDNPITLPVIVGFSDAITMEIDLFLGKNHTYAHNNNNFTNIPLSGEQVEFVNTKFVYGSTGKTFDKWGYNAHVGKEGLTIGKTSLGSIIYNSTFETDTYFQFNVFSDLLKYSLDVAQVDNTKFLYLHNMNVRPFKNFSFSIIEGSLLNSDFELRYLNPLMLMHSFGSWNEYDNLMTKTEFQLYEEGKFCAYLAADFEYVPFNNLRIYGLFAQNEMLDFGGSRDTRALSMPDSIGFQLGVDYNLPLKYGYLKTNLESVYTSPYLYVKQSPDWSLWRTRTEMQNDGTVSSWIGSPFGPDCFATQLMLTYDSGKKWKAGIGYLFKIHGENTAENLFSSKNNQNINLNNDEGDVSIWTYYPLVKWWLAYLENDKDGMEAAKNIARNMWMHGTNEFTNQIIVNGQYSLLKNLTIYGQVIYSLVYNNDNIENSFDQGLELSLALEYKLFN